MFPPTPTWPLALGGCWGSAFWRTSTIRSLPTTSLISGGAACLHGNVVPGLCVYPDWRQQGRPCRGLRVVQGHVSGVLFGRGSLYLLLTYGGMLLLCTIAATPLRKACYEKLNARLRQPGADICRLRRTRLCVGGVHGVFSQRQLQSVPVLPIPR